MKSPAIILVRPQLGENIGAAARAMANFGLGELRLVAPRDGWPNTKATDMATIHGEHVINNAKVFATLEEAIADLHYVAATTARIRDMEKPVLNVREFFSPRLRGEAGGGLLPQKGGFGRKSNTTRDLEALEKASNLRKSQADAEKKLWHYIRNKQLGGYKFRRQQTIGIYIVDFLCKSQKLIIELDGAQHQNQKFYDENRTKFLEESGYKVIRIWNGDIFFNIEGVLESILHALQTRNSPPLNLPPQAGGEILNTGIMFGPERTGLTNEEVAIADILVTIPVSPDCPSLNVAQSVSIVCYEWFLSQLSAISYQPSEINLAKKSDITSLFNHLERELDQKQYFRVPEKRKGMINNMRNMLTKMNLTEQEAKTMRGIINTLSTKN